MVATPHMYLHNRCRKQLIKGIIVKCLRVLLQTLQFQLVLLQKTFSQYISVRAKSLPPPCLSHLSFICRNSIYLSHLCACVSAIKGLAGGFPSVNITFSSAAETRAALNSLSPHLSAQRMVLNLGFCVQILSYCVV